MTPIPFGERTHPVWDALRVQTLQGIPTFDQLSGISSLSGLGNSIILFHSSGADLELFDPIEAGLVAALAAAASGDTVWIPSMTIPILSAITIAAGVTLCGLSLESTISGSVINNGTLQQILVIGDISTTGDMNLVRVYNASPTTHGVTVSGSGQPHVFRCRINLLNAPADTYGLYSTAPDARLQWVEANCFSSGTNSINRAGAYVDAVSPPDALTRPVVFSCRFAGDVGAFIQDTPFVSNCQFEADSTDSGTAGLFHSSGTGYVANSYAKSNRAGVSIKSTGGTLTLSHVAAPDGTSGSIVVTGESSVWFNVRDYGALGDGSNDDTSAINAAITAIPATGGVLYFPAGNYKTTGGFTLSKPITVRGDGNADQYDSTAKTISLITDDSATNSLFTVSSKGCSFFDIALKNVAGSTPSNGAGITVSTASAEMMHYENISIGGFYIGLDIQQGWTWFLDHAYIWDVVLYGLKIRNIAAPDGSNAMISNSVFMSGPVNHTPTSAIRLESGGGPKITNCKIINAAGADAWTNGIDINLTSLNTSVLLVSNCSFENLATNGAGIKITTDAASTWRDIAITGNQFNMSGVTGASAIRFVAGAAAGIYNFTITGNIFSAGASTNAIEITNCDHGVIIANSNDGFTNLLSQTTSTNIDTGGVGTVTNIATGTGLTGGPITTTGTISDANTGVAAATYGDANNIPQFTVNAQGRLTAAANVAISTLAPINVYNETQTADGVSLTYYLTNYAAPSTIRVYIDGIRQPASDDVAPSDTVVFDVAPDLGAVLLFDYEMDQS